MSSAWRRERLPQIAAQLARRPGHNETAHAVATLLTEGLGRAIGDITFEHRMPLVSGRADALFGDVVFEFKRDLRREMPDVMARLPDYLRDRERETRRRALGICTDGATFHAFELDGAGLRPLGEFRTHPQRGPALLQWLEGAISERENLDPTPDAIRQALGRGSIAFLHAMTRLDACWAALAGHGEAQLKRTLWNRLLREVYGEEVGSDQLFLQHTFLTIVAKTIAARAFGLDVTDPAALLSGQALEERGIGGAVEGDLFDWVLHHPGGPGLVEELARHASRFRLGDVAEDVMKSLYESLIDPAQRKDLGEYYTPDWLAARLTERAVARPLEQRVLDPACGSGTFLFHAIRRLRAAAGAAGWEAGRIIAACEAQVRGLDVHPVAVIIARVTWLLALGPALLRDRPARITVPVFLGDALQWAVRPVVSGRELEVEVPDAPPLRVPGAFAEDQARLEGAVAAIREGLDRARPAAAVHRRLALLGAPAADTDAMADTYARILALHAAGRDGVWPFVLRNLARPLQLSRPDQQADVLLGNPPWVAFRHLSAPIKARVREDSQRFGLWVGGHVATQQDLCALFTLKAAQLYLKPGGTLAFLLPMTVLARPVHAGLRRAESPRVQLRWEEAWRLSDAVQPLFPVPACALLGRKVAAGPVPATVLDVAGRLPRRDATAAQAAHAVTATPRPWPPIPSLAGASPYRARFRNGATIFPRRFFFVEREGEGLLGGARDAPLLRGRAGQLDKAPWNTLAPPRGPVEARFVRPVLLGEHLLPFRLLDPAPAVLPLRPDGTVLDAALLERTGEAPRLQGWMEQVEAAWNAHASRAASGTGPRITLTENLDHLRKLSCQFPGAPLRVAHVASGTLLVAAILREAAMVVEHAAYWAPARSEAEAAFLCTLLNSERIRAAIAPLQPRGLGGARHFDNLMWELPIPEYDARDALHRDIAAAGAACEAAAARVALDPARPFTRHRPAIRAALHAELAAAEALIARLPGL